MNANLQNAIKAASELKSTETAYQKHYKTSKATNHKKAYWTLDNIRKAGSALIDAIDAIRNGSDCKVSISQGNVKTGSIPSVSLLPGITCPKRCKETCGVACYAWKIALLRSNVMKSYAKNTAIATLFPDLYFKQVMYAAIGSRWFRFHVSGDIPNKKYFDKMIETVKACPETTFLCFTKRYEIVNNWIGKNGELPVNLKLLFSGWTGTETINPYNLPETTVYTDEPSENWLLCGGNCFECSCRGCGCWKAEKGETIAFKLH